jgi:hypothetical protein
MKKSVPFLCVLATIVASSAHGAPKSGFAVTNMTQVSSEAFTIPSKTFDRRAQRDRLTFSCTNCTGVGTEGIDIIIGKSRDGTEGRLRSGRTTIADIERICRTGDPNCRVEAVKINGAVGWVTRARILGMINASTTILYKNGDMLTIRSFSDNAEIAYSNGRAAREQLAPRIVGPD